MKLDRLLSIVIMLLNRKRVQARDLAEHFDVSVRTIYRDIDAINNAGIPIVTYQGNKGGVGLIDSYKIDRQVLTLEDMVAMLSVLKGMNSTFKDRQLQAAIEKIDAIVPESKQEFVKNHVEQIVIDVMPWGISGGQKRNMVALQQAIAGKWISRFSYRDSNGACSIRSVEPMTLIFKAAAWYLFAYCELRCDFRLFRLTRMNQLEILKQNYFRRSVNYKEYDSGLPEKEKMIRLVVKFSNRIRQNAEDYFDESSLKYEKNGDIIASFELPENDWVASYLLSLGEYAEVLEPEKMRILLQEKAKKIATLYKHDTLLL